MTDGVSATPVAVEGVLFDVDDTLVDTRAAFAESIAAASRVWLPHLPEERYDEVLALWRSDPNGHYRAYTRGEVDFDAQRMARANELQATFGGALLDDAAYVDWKDLFWGTFEASWAAFDDSRPVVDALVAAGVRVGSLTNARVELQTRKLAAAGLADVPLLVGVDTLGFGKPDPSCFLEACRRLGTDPSRTAYVGDELDVDALGAIKAGLLGVWLDRPGTRRGRVTTSEIDSAGRAGVVTIARLTELLAARSLALPAATRSTSSSA
ncbi:putative hydrolase of the HAD superfamily [Cellulosimicrobium cellulans]|uniref:HAD family hydrolase n=1 Tax=Cellulosimicrobium cellulans TaxID=1710 RepID=UPI00195A6458|nr:HAD family hydrolase [Cellulosimicrobium cellulans]MBM7820588.1 putative hydrolase of the HAD superfamily [Cellulosimicrobium cellulans]